MQVRRIGNQHRRKCAKRVNRRTSPLDPVRRRNMDAPGAVDRLLRSFPSSTDTAAESDELSATPVADDTSTVSFGPSIVCTGQPLLEADATPSCQSAAHSARTVVPRWELTQCILLITPPCCENTGHRRLLRPRHHVMPKYPVSGPWPRPCDGVRRPTESPLQKWRELVVVKTYWRAIWCVSLRETKLPAAGSPRCIVAETEGSPAVTAHPGSVGLLPRTIVSTRPSRTRFPDPAWTLQLFRNSRAMLNQNVAVKLNCPLAEGAARPWTRTSQCCWITTWRWNLRSSGSSWPACQASMLFGDRPISWVSRFVCVQTACTLLAFRLTAVWWPVLRAA